MQSGAGSEKDGGFRCPHCTGRTCVRDSRPRHGSIYRRRVCLSCKRRFSTYEVMAVGEGTAPILSRSLVDLRTSIVKMTDVAAVLEALDNLRAE